MLMTTKRHYEKPAMQEFELKHQPQILAGSNGDAGLEDYNWNNIIPE